MKTFLFIMPKTAAIVLAFRESHAEVENRVTDHFSWDSLSPPQVASSWHNTPLKYSAECTCSSNSCMVYYRSWLLYNYVKIFVFFFSKTTWTQDVMLSFLSAYSASSGNNLYMSCADGTNHSV